jgi:hypothetical protein
MKLRVFRILNACVLLPLLAQAAALEEKQTIRKTLAASRRVEIDNVFGSIHITGSDASAVAVVIEETIKADSAEEVARARQEVKLDVSEQGDTARIYVDGPFRCHCPDGARGFRDRERSRYQVTYDFEIQAPRNASVALRTVNNGEIRVSGVSGDFDVENVNGGVEMREMSGSGHAHTVNGPVRVTFRKNPAGQTSFRSINGEIDLLFQPGLSADLRMKTFNGHIYSDFPVDALPARPATTTQRNGKLVYKADGFSGARIGNGGAEILLDGFNGDIRIRKTN